MICLASVLGHIQESGQGGDPLRRGRDFISEKFDVHERSVWWGVFADPPRLPQ